MSAIEPSAPHPKPGTGREVIDRQAVKLAGLANRECAACGEAAANSHHVLPKDRGGDDVPENIIGLCGSGTMGCHGAHHGNPYVVDRGCRACGAPSDEWCSTPTGWRRGDHRIRVLDRERRDAQWVNQRIGATLTQRRQDAIRYVIGKLGPVAGEHFLRSTYAIRLDDDNVWRQAPEAAPLIHYNGCCELAP